MGLLFKRLALSAHSDACVLLQGESGTGKELAAQSIHRFSARVNGPFVAASLAALSPAMADSELFGHVHGAFADAREDRGPTYRQRDGAVRNVDLDERQATCQREDCVPPPLGTDLRLA